ncbi:MAG: hypothetical protein IJB64_10145 [Akkermansia sp.]|nr:hypothetical protein [Akkermansia sp.]
MSDDADVKIGISLDTSKLPEQVKRAEEEIKGAVEGTTEAIEAQGDAAEETAGKIETAAQKAKQLQQADAGRMKQATSQAAASGKKLVADTAKNVQSMGKAVAGSMQGMAQGANKTLTQVAAGAQATGGQIQTAMAGASAATGGLTTALGVAKGAMDLLTKGFAILGLFNQVVSSIKLVMDWWKELQKEVISAGQKVANQWRLAREEAENTARMRAPHESLKEQIELNDRLLEQLRERNAFEAQMAQMKAERAGNRRGVQRAILDGQLARGEISSREHLEAVRRLEDAEREEAQAGRMQELTNARDEAQTKYEAQAEEHRTASRNLREGVQGAIRAGILNEGGVERREHWEKLATRWADANEIVTNYDGPSIFNSGHQNVLERREYERAFSERAALRQEILAGAEYLGIQTKTTDEEGKMVDRDFAEVAAEVMRVWEEKRGKLREEVNTQTEEENAAREELNKAQARVDELERTQDEEDRGVLQRRAQEDATLAHRADAAADKAEATAEAARVEQARREERAALQAGKAAEEAELQAAQGMLAGAMQMLRERASAEQQPAVAALEALLARAEREPEVLGQIEALMRGGQLSVTDDQNRRYGNELRLVGNSGLDKDAVLGLLNLLGHVEYRQGRVDEYGGQLEDMDRRDADAAEEQRRQRVRDQEEAARAARQHAEAEAEAARRSRGASGAAPLEGLDGALSAGADAMNAQGAVGDAAVAAMGAFNSTATALVGTAAAQAGQIEALRAGQVGLQQQISNINRTNIC